MSNKKEVWPVMLTLFTDSGKIDYDVMRVLIEWYERAGVDGLFAVCQSSEMFFLSPEERVELAGFVKKHAGVPVIASGHISHSVAEQILELRRIGETGVDGLVLVSNRLAPEGGSTEEWRASLEDIMNALDPNIPLGMYECPYPYKRLLSNEEVAFCASTGRFRFMKDTCCDIEIIKERLHILRGSSFRMYNANTATVAESYRAGAAGFSGVMANFHPELYVLLSQIWHDTERANILQSILTLCSGVERQLYPVNAKYHLQTIGLPAGIYTRSKPHDELSELFKTEIRQMGLMIEWAKGVLSENRIGS